MRELKEMNELILIIINKVIFVVLLMENNANTLFHGLLSNTYLLHVSKQNQICWRRYTCGSAFHTVTWREKFLDLSGTTSSIKTSTNSNRQSCYESRCSLK